MNMSRYIVYFTMFFFSVMWGQDCVDDIEVELWGEIFPEDRRRSWVVVCHEFIKDLLRLVNHSATHASRRRRSQQPGC